MKPEKATIEKMHRWFAIEANNRGWELTAKEARTETEDEEMLHLAFVASHHWRQIGSPLNYARADMLLAHACSHLRLAELALKFARRCHEFCGENECTDWDVAFSEAELAYATAVTGASEEAAKHMQLAESKGSEIADPEDKKIFVAELERIRAEIASL